MSKRVKVTDKQQKTNRTLDRRFCVAPFVGAENLMLAARAAGLGSCWIGFAQSWLATPEGKMTINLPPTYLPVAPIALGHPQAVPFSVPRKQPEIHWIGG